MVCPPHGEGSGFVYFVLTAFQNTAKYPEGYVFGRKQGDIECQQRGTSHGIHIAQGVSCRNLTEGVGIGADRRKEIGGYDKCGIVV